jgi:hypothetical protein
MNAHHAFLRAAKRSNVDPEALLDVAEDELSAKAIAEVVAVLVDRHGYRLPKCRRDVLIDRLLAAGVEPVRVADRLGVSRKTVARRLEAQPPPVDRMDKRSNVDKMDAHDPWPILTFSATGGPDNVAAIRKALATGRRT